MMKKAATAAMATLAFAMAASLGACAPRTQTGSGSVGSSAIEETEKAVAAEANLGAQLQTDTLRFSFTWCGWADEVRSESGDAGLQGDEPGTSYLVMSGTIENTGDADAVLGFGAGGAFTFAVECGGVNADATVLADEGGFSPILAAGASTKVVAFATMPDSVRNSKQPATWTVSGFKVDGTTDASDDGNPLSYYKRQPSWIWTINCATA